MRRETRPPLRVAVMMEDAELRVDVIRIVGAAGHSSVVLSKPRLVEGARRRFDAAIVQCASDELAQQAAALRDALDGECPVLCMVADKAPAPPLPQRAAALRVPCSRRELLDCLCELVDADAERGTFTLPFEIDGLLIDILEDVYIEGARVRLTRLESRLLLALVRARGAVLSRESLLRSVWNMRTDVATRTVDTHVRRLKAKLGRFGARIEGVRREGYRFEGRAG
jgi:hypothetical protein